MFIDALVRNRKKQDSKFTTSILQLNNINKIFDTYITNIFYFY